MSFHSKKDCLLVMHHCMAQEMVVPFLISLTDLLQNNKICFSLFISALNQKFRLWSFLLPWSFLSTFIMNALNRGITLVFSEFKPMGVQYQWGCAVVKILTVLVIIHQSVAWFKVKYTLSALQMDHTETYF